MTDNTDIVARLTNYDKIASEMPPYYRALMRGAAKEIERLRAERDKARREVCNWIELKMNCTARKVAEARGWYCFKGVTNDNP